MQIYVGIGNPVFKVEAIYVDDSALFSGDQQLILLACAITHHPYLQSIVLEPCSRLIVQINEAIDPLKWSVDGTGSIGDVVCRLFD